MRSLHVSESSSRLAGSSIKVRGLCSGDRM